MIQKIHNCNDNNQNNLITNNNNLLNYFVYYTNYNNNSNKNNINFDDENDFIKEISKKKKEKETKGTQLIFINLGIKRIRKKILEYSLPSSSYFPSKISYSNNEEEYLLLFACKKYNKNGILLIIPNNKQEILVEFFEIDFEIHCIFPTTKINNETDYYYPSSEGNEAHNSSNQNQISIINENNKANFLAGGFDYKENKPKVKLYELKFKKSGKAKIKEIHNIELEINQNFTEPIIGIDQYIDSNHYYAINKKGGIQLFYTYSK